MHLSSLLDYLFDALIGLFINITPCARLMFLFAALGKQHAFVCVTAFIIKF